ncbi:helix-turn-helix domain-containing protein [Cupriavidus sp. 30B13]|uniref:helix-turn-helix domain-containing protein n=1 Tax=Cupriavidus sp. 30B13 TaxID=3384241 RepID=UPI003B919927
MRYPAGVEIESEWRRSPRVSLADEPHACALGKWSDRRHEARHVMSPRLDHHYTIEILMSDTVVDCVKDGGVVCLRRGQFGAAQVTAPGEQVCCRFERPNDAIHLFVPRATMHEALLRCHAGAHAQPVLRDPGYRPDPTLGRIMAALSEAGTDDGPGASLFVESACQTVIAYLVRMQEQRQNSSARPAGLQTWRLRKVMSYIAANAGEAISLQSMADQAGLSRMHFAAQFLLATGMTPHAYLNRTRLELAKGLLTEGTAALAEIALQTGFHSQAHFTSVFRKEVGTPPGQWRNQCLEARAANGAGAERNRPAPLPALR